jgi:hypothetical protein
MSQELVRGNPKVAESDSVDGTQNCQAREAIGVFANLAMLEAAIDALEISGFDRATISVLASDEKVKERVGHLYRTVAEIAADRQAPQGAFVSNGSLVEGEAAAVGIPIYIGGAAGAFAVVALGGALALAIAAAITGGVVGAGLGALLARAIAHRHAAHVLAQLEQGGLVLWVHLRDDHEEEFALKVLTTAGAGNIHVHEIKREWGLKDVPFSKVQPDPFLERDR